MEQSDESVDSKQATKPKLCLINPLRGPCPPGGFRFVFEQDGFVVHAWCYTDWVGFARDHARANDLPVPTGEAMQEQLCLTLEPGWCSYDDDNRPRPSMLLEWKDVLRAAETFTKWIEDGLQIVDKAEAERRALICARCPLNIPITGCSVCQGTINKLASKLPETHSDSFLKSCAVCHCTLKMKIWLPIKTLDKGIQQHQNLYSQVQHCWMNTNGNNFQPD